MIHRILLVGIGPHAKRVYIPWLLDNPKRCQLVAAVELKSNTKLAKEYLKTQKIAPELVLTDVLKSNKLPGDIEKKLTDIIQRHKINTIIIASEPTAHIQYALWALRHGLNVLMDKPITTRRGAATKLSAAKGILKDYLMLERAYTKAKAKNPKIIFSVNVQRRFDHKFDIVRELISKVSQQTGCPVTSILSSTGDGQWRLPNEVIDLEYHGYSNGYGKGSHSGYHTFDLLCQFMHCGVPEAKRPDTVEIIATATKPKDYFAQLRPEEYKQIFKDHELPAQPTQKELVAASRGYGEIDLFTHFVFKNNGSVICTAQSSLLHNSYSMRSWVKPNDDLYKGNGRVKQEHHFIEQGPFQSVQIHSYQSFHRGAERYPFSANGKEHFEIHIFRNSKLIGGKPYQKISAEQFESERAKSKLEKELEGKAFVLEEFFNCIDGSIKRTQLRSDLLTHRNSVVLMSAVYAAQIRKQTIKTKLKTA